MDKHELLAGFIEYIDIEHGAENLRDLITTGMITQAAAAYLSDLNGDKCALLVWLEDECPTVQKMTNPITNDQAKQILREYTREAIKEIFESMENTMVLRKKYKSANLTFKSWVKMRRNSDATYGMPKHAKPYNPNI